MIAALAVNDLEGVVIGHHPQIGTLRDALRRSGAILAQMSGSGSTVFGVFDATGATVTTLVGEIERGGARVIATGTVETVAVVDLT
jgi:4-diphosphocytidyl-2C-methyl-D-erythritol kinase